MTLYALYNANDCLISYLEKHAPEVKTFIFNLIEKMKVSGEFQISTCNIPIELSRDDIEGWKNRKILKQLLDNLEYKYEFSDEHNIKYANGFKHYFMISCLSDKL